MEEKSVIQNPVGGDPAYRGALRAYIQRNARPAHKFGHQPRLYALTRAIGRDLTYDDDVVFAAVWLHDLGVFVGHRPEDPAALKAWDHVAYAIAQTPGILREAGFPPEKIEAVFEVIAHHQPKDTPSSVESMLVRDADIVEQLGAIGIFRTAAKLGSDTRFLTFEDAARSLRKALDTLPGLLQLPAAQLLARAKMDAMRAFLDSLKAEAVPELY